MARMFPLPATLVTLLAGCQPANTPTDLTVVATSLDDRADHVPPTASLSVDLSQAPDADSLTASAMMLIEGAADSNLVERLTDIKPDPELRERLHSARLALDGARIELTPRSPMKPDALYTLVVAGLRAGSHRLAAPVMRPFMTGPSTIGRPVLQLLQPAVASLDVPRNLRAVEIAFSRPVENVSAASLFLASEGSPVPASLEGGSCATCYRIVPHAPLAPQMRLDVMAREPICDEEGAPVFVPDPPPSFSTGTDLRRSAPLVDQIVPRSSSGCLVVRWRTDVSASSRLCADQTCVEDAALVRWHELGVALAPGSRARVTLSSRDETTAPAAAVGPFAAPVSSPRHLVISEVLSRPLGSWPAQQFVEIHNMGSEQETLADLELHDEGGSNLLPDISLPPDGFALIVPSGYSATGPDPEPAAGAAIVRLPQGRIGANGIRMSGEDLSLVEADGRLVSRFSTYDLTTVKGQSVSRAGDCDVSHSYAATSSGKSTPGWR